MITEEEIFRYCMEINDIKIKDETYMASYTLNFTLPVQYKEVVIQPDFSFVSGYGIGQVIFDRVLPVKGRFPKKCNAIYYRYRNLSEFVFDIDALPSIKHKTPSGDGKHYYGFEFMLEKSCLPTKIINSRKERIYRIHCNITENNIDVLYDIIKQKAREIVLYITDHDVAVKASEIIGKLPKDEIRRYTIFYRGGDFLGYSKTNSLTFNILLDVNIPTKKGWME